MHATSADFPRIWHASRASSAIAYGESETKKANRTRTTDNHTAKPVGVKKASVCRVVTRACPRAPLLPGHEFQPDAVIVDHQISVVVTPDCAGFDFLHLLRHDAHIGSAIAALVAEAIELKTVAEPHQRDDVFLEAHVGTPSATASTSPSAAMSAAAMYTAAAMSAAAMYTATAMPATGTMARMTDAMPATTGTRMATTLVRRAGALADVVSGFRLPTAVMLWTFAEIGLPVQGSMLSRPVAVNTARTFTNIWLVTVEWSLAAEIAAAWLVTRLQHLLSVATPIIELAVTRPVGTGKSMLDPLVFITHAAPVVGIMIPVLDAHVVPIHVPVEVKILIDIDVKGAGGK